ncbi:MAG TPA: carboxypeptidase-like regulatory domain-containing protein, partial [Solirubrobacterales bacterium]
VFGGKVVGSGQPEVVPPAGSGYGRTLFEVPTIEGDTTVVVEADATVHLTGTLRNAGGDPVAGASMSVASDQTGATAFAKTDGEGRFDLTVLPGDYRFVGQGSGGAPDLPAKWSFVVPSVALEADRELGDLKLPPTSQLTVEVRDPEGAPIPESQVRIPIIDRQADLGPVFATSLATRGEGPANGPQGITDEKGRVSFRVFGGKVVGSGQPEVVPPAGSGYGRTLFEVPTIEGDTTVVVQFTKGEEEEPEEGEDVKGPQLNEFGVEPGPIDTSESPQTVFAYANISDDLSGFSKGLITFRAPSGENLVSSSNFKRVTGDANAGDYHVPITFPQFSEAGIWSIESIRLYDKTGNETVIKEIDLQELGWQRTVTVAGEKADEEAPMIDAIAVEPETIDTTGTSRTVTVFAHITDDLAGVKQVGVSFGSPNGNVAYTGWAYKPVSGSSTDGIYEIQVSFQPFSEVGTWDIIGISLDDAAGHSRFLGQGQIEELGLQREVLVEGVSDTQGPTINELGIEPTSVDTSSEPRLVTLRAHIEDDLSGFSHGKITFTSPSGAQS